MSCRINQGSKLQKFEKHSLGIADENNTSKSICKLGDQQQFFKGKGGYVVCRHMSALGDQQQSFRHKGEAICKHRQFQLFAVTIVLGKMWLYPVRLHSDRLRTRAKGCSRSAQPLVSADHGQFMV